MMQMLVTVNHLMMFSSFINPLYLNHIKSQTGQLTILKIRYQRKNPLNCIGIDDIYYFIGPTPMFCQAISQACKRSCRHLYRLVFVIIISPIWIQIPSGFTYQHTISSSYHKVKESSSMIWIRPTQQIFPAYFSSTFLQFVAYPCP